RGLGPGRDVGRDQRVLVVRRSEMRDLIDDSGRIGPLRWIFAGADLVVPGGQVGSRVLSGSRIPGARCPARIEVIDKRFLLDPIRGKSIPVRRQDPVRRTTIRSEGV